MALLFVSKVSQGLKIHIPSIYSKSPGWDYKSYLRRGDRGALPASPLPMGWGPCQHGTAAPPSEILTGVKGCWSAMLDTTASACAEGCSGMFIKAHPSPWCLSVFKGTCRAAEPQSPFTLSVLCSHCAAVRGCWWASLRCSGRGKAMAKWQRAGNLPKRLS